MGEGAGVAGGKPAGLAGQRVPLHRQGFGQTAGGDLLGTGFAVAEKDRLYRCLDRIVEHKTAFFEHLRQL